MTRRQNSTHRFGLLLVPQFPMYVLMLATEALRVANKYSRHIRYSWHIATLDGEPAVASNGMSISPECVFNQLDNIDTLAVIVGYEPQQAYSPRLFQRLHQLNDRGVRIGCVDSGAFLLAKAGLLNHLDVTLHWQAVSMFTEEFPACAVSERLFTVSEKRFTCAGGAAILDLMLTLIARDFGEELALQVAQDFVHDHIRPATGDQRAALDHRWARIDPRLARIIELMENNIESPLTAEELAEQSGIPRRQMERSFKREIGQTTMRYYLQRRLNLARELVLYSRLSFREVSLASGFNSLASFSRAYRHVFGETARQDRAGNRLHGIDAGTVLQLDASHRSSDKSS